MALPANDDFANCELSAEELAAIAAGWPHWLKTVVRDVVKVAEYAVPFLPAILVGGYNLATGNYSATGNPAPQPPAWSWSW